MIPTGRGFPAGRAETRRNHMRNDAGRVEYLEELDSGYRGALAGRSRPARRFGHFLRLHRDVGQ